MMPPQLRDQKYRAKLRCMGLFSKIRKLPHPPPPRRVSCAAASPQIPTTSDSRSPVRWAARSAMSSRSHSVAGIIVRCIAPATSARGGGSLASTRSRLLAGSGKRRTEWARECLKNQHYLGRMTLPQPRSQVQRASRSAPPPSRKKAPACRIFPASRNRSAGCSRIVTMWRPSGGTAGPCGVLRTLEGHAHDRSAGCRSAIVKLRTCVEKQRSVHSRCDCFCGADRRAVALHDAPARGADHSGSSDLRPRNGGRFGGNEMTS
jgi:hypothetical protein